jgi:hypothetical protein
VTTLEIKRGAAAAWGNMKHSEWAYVVITLAIVGPCFGVILMRPAPAPEAWLTIGAVCGFWFGRSNGNVANGGSGK